MDGGRRSASARQEEWLTLRVARVRIVAEREAGMRVSLQEIQEEVQAGRTMITTVKPVVVNIEVRAHPQGIVCSLRILGEQGDTTLTSSHVIADLRALCVALGIDEQEACWQSCSCEPQPDGYVPFLFF